MNGQRIWDTRILVNGTVFPETPVTCFRIEASRFERCDAAEIHLAVDRNILGDKRPWFDPEQDVRLDIQLQMRQQEWTIKRGRNCFMVWLGMSFGIPMRHPWFWNVGIICLSCSICAFSNHG